MRMTNKMAAAREMPRRSFSARRRGVALTQICVLLASASLGDLRAAESAVIALPPFAAPLHWTASDALVRPAADGRGIVSVKDPSIVFYNNRWHIYATTASTNGAWGMVYLSFADWADAASAKPYYLDENPNLRGYHCAPQVFYFRPQKKWYLIYQSGPPQYSTADDLAKPETWTKPENFFPTNPPEVAKSWLDFWIICDDTHAYLFCTGDNGRLYRSRTKIENFPNGMSTPEVVIEGSREGVFEGGMTYKLKGANAYLTLVEAIGPGTRYYRAWISDRLDGEWKPLPEATTFEKPFAGINNVRFADGVAPWTKDISHGELIRDGYDETPTIDPNNLQLLFQGRDPAINTSYSQLPYKLGLLTLDTAAKNPQPAAIRIKAGLSTAFTDSKGNVWEPEQGFVGGDVVERDPAPTITNTKDPQLYFSEHFSMESFSRKVPNGKYVARLHFAETFEGITGPGERVFTFNVHGREFKDFDVWAKAGGPNRAYIEAVPVAVTNGEFRITFTSNVENPMINAIEILPAEGNITGRWSGEFDSQIGRQKYLFTFQTDGDKLTGKAASEVGDWKRETDLKEGKIASDTISFVEVLEFQDNELRIRYTGKIGGDEITFTREVGELAAEKFKAARVASPLLGQ